MKPEKIGVSVEGNGKKPAVMDLVSRAGVQEGQSSSLPAEQEKELKAATFQDERWNNAVRWLQGKGMMTREKALEVIEHGSKLFGLWHLHPQDVEGLVAQILCREEAASATTSPALSAWTDSMLNKKPPASPEPLKKGKSGNKLGDVSIPGILRKPARTAQSEDWGHPLMQMTTLKRMEYFWLFFVLVVSNRWAMKVVLPRGYEKALEVFGWPIYVARGCGMGTAVLTGLLYTSMARGSLTLLSKLVAPGNILTTVLDAHKELHIAFGKMLGWFSFVHVVAHCFSTLVAIMQAHDSAAELAGINSILGCANPNKKSFWFWGKAHLLWPSCPITTRYGSVMEVMFNTTIGLSGVGLIVVLAVIAYTATQEQRTQNFELFWYVHNGALVLWPVLMYIHGANAWMGVGVPLIVFTTAVPLLAYLADRLMRHARFRMYRAMDSSIRSAVVRPGKKQGKAAVDGSMVYVKVKRPPALWSFRPGMYAFICMPEYSQFQWHPFTICSGEKEDDVGFIIAAVGNWTKELARRILEAKEAGDEEEMRQKLPKLALDGPYAAPTQTALANEVLVVVGAGVGITPFLSLMSTIIYRVSSIRRSHSGLSMEKQQQQLRMKHAHFFWMTRAADEFLFAQSMLTDVVDRAELHDKISLHLHVTAKEPEGDPQAFLFREALRRQSKVDQRAFKEVTSNAEFQKQVGGALPSAPMCPVGWLHGDNQDVLWVESILEDRPHANRPPQTALPIVFGRPNFAKEVAAIGKANPENDICIYICGNDAIVKNLQDVAKDCNDSAEAAPAGSWRQRYEVHYERFG